MSNYKGFTLNGPGTPAPWGTIENALDEDEINTIVGDSIQGAKDTAGHKHASLYDSSLNSKVTAVSGGANIAGDVDITGQYKINGTPISNTTNQLVDWLSSANVQGLTSINSNYSYIVYKKSDNLVHVWFNLIGTSTSTNFTFTLPVAFSSIKSLPPSWIYFPLIEGADNNTPCIPTIYLENGSIVATIYKTYLSHSWTATGAKYSSGYFCYPSD